MSNDRSVLPEDLNASQRLAAVARALGLVADGLEPVPAATARFGSVDARDALDGHPLLIHFEQDLASAESLVTLMAEAAVGRSEATLVWVAPRFDPACLAAVRWSERIWAIQGDPDATDVGAWRVAAGPTTPYLDLSRSRAWFFRLLRQYFRTHGHRTLAPRPPSGDLCRWPVHRADALLLCSLTDDAIRISLEIATTRPHGPVWEAILAKLPTDTPLDPDVLAREHHGDPPRTTRTWTRPWTPHDLSSAEASCAWIFHSVVALRRALGEPAPPERDDDPFDDVADYR